MITVVSPKNVVTSAYNTRRSHIDNQLVTFNGIRINPKSTQDTTSPAKPFKIVVK